MSVAVQKTIFIVCCLISRQMLLWILLLMLLIFFFQIWSSKLLKNDQKGLFSTLNQNHIMGFQFLNNLEDTTKYKILTFLEHCSWTVFKRYLLFPELYSEKKGETSCKLNGKAPVNYKLGLSLILFFLLQIATPQMTARRWQMNIDNNNRKTNYASNKLSKFHFFSAEILNYI